MSSMGGGGSSGAYPGAGGMSASMAGAYGARGSVGGAPLDRGLALQQLLGNSKAVQVGPPLWKLPVYFGVCKGSIRAAWAAAAQRQHPPALPSSCMVERMVYGNASTVREAGLELRRVAG